MKLYDQQPGGTTVKARQLRREAPAPERPLLRAVRESLPALEWRHQVPVGPFYADILCFSERLVIELDGDTHGLTSPADASRAALMARAGYRTLRVANGDVINNLDGVPAHIASHLGIGHMAKEKGGTA